MKEERKERRTEYQARISKEKAFDMENHIVTSAEIRQRKGAALDISNGRDPGSRWPGSRRQAGKEEEILQ